MKFDGHLAPAVYGGKELWNRSEFQVRNKKKYNGAMLRCTMKMMNENGEMACDNAVNMISRILTKGISEFQR